MSVVDGCWSGSSVQPRTYTLWDSGDTGSRLMEAQIQRPGGVVVPDSALLLT